MWVCFLFVACAFRGDFACVWILRFGLICVVCIAFNVYGLYVRCLFGFGCFGYVCFDFGLMLVWIRLDSFVGYCFFVLSAVLWCLCFGWFCLFYYL